MKMSKDRVDPELLDTLEMIEQAIGGEMNLDDIPAAREITRQFSDIRKAQAALIDGVTMEEKHAPGPEESPNVLVRVYQPEKRPDVLPALLWIHGGGYVLGSAEQDDLQGRELCRNLQCMVVSVDYRLAPEHPFPAPLEDCYAALKWLNGQHQELGINPERIAIGGPSAGGGLTAGLALASRDRGEVNVAFQLLIYPMIDDRNIEPPGPERPDTFIWSRGNNLIGWRSYLDGRQGSDDVSTYAAAFRATDLTGLPPTHISIGELDLFLDENIIYAHRLLAAGVPTELHIFPGAYHGFNGFVPSAAVSKRCNVERDTVLKRFLHD